MKIITIKWVIGTLNSMALLFIGFLFVLSFMYPREGAVFVIYSSILLLFIGVMFVAVHFLERRNENYQLALAKLHRYLSLTIKTILTIGSGLAFIVSCGFFIFSGKTVFLLNGGCFIAFTMIIILIELFIRILLPLAGVDQNI